MKYRDHKSIPNKYRRLILDETMAKRVGSVPLVICNSIIEDYEEKELENELLTDYEVIVSKNGQKSVIKFKDIDSALVQMDNVIGFFEKDPSVVTVLRQAGRIIKAYVKGQWINGSVSIYD